MGIQNAQCGLPSVIAGLSEHGFESIEVFADFSAVNHVPSITCKSLGNIVRTGQRRAAINGDAVVIKYAHQTIKTKMPR